MESLPTEETPETPSKSTLQLKDRSSLLIIVVLILVAAGFVYTWWQSGAPGFRSISNDSESTSSGQPNQSPEPTSQLTIPTFRSESGKFSADDPANWSIQYPTNWASTTLFDVNEGVLYLGLTLTPPSKATELIFSLDNIDKGGACLSGENEVPHQALNTCETREFYSKEKIGEIYNIEAGKRKPVYLVTYRHTGTDGKSSYVIGLTNADEALLEINKPLMGPYPEVGTYVAIFDKTGEFIHHLKGYALGTTQSFLTSAEAAQVKSILRSFKQN